MFIAHLVPGYFAAALSQPRWRSDWGPIRRAALWLFAFGGTVAPDLDVIYNLLFRGFFGHSVLWTHSVFPYLGLGFVWLLLREAWLWPYPRTAIGLVAIGGLSHVLLDALSHGTPLLYPFSRKMIGYLSPRVLEGGAGAYITDPIFLLEPLLVTAAAAHWIMQRRLTAPIRYVGVLALFTL